MNNELQKRLYETEVMPPAAVWERLSVNIDEINADNMISRKISVAEVLPPVSVWEKLSSSIDEMNADNIISKKVSASEVLPPASVWQKIKISIGIVEETYPEKKGRVINIRRLAVAAVFIGIIVAAWLLLRDYGAGNTDEIVSGEKSIVIPAPSDTINKIDSPVNKSFLNPTPAIASTSATKTSISTRKNNTTKASGRTGKNTPAQASTGELAALIHNAPGEKSFDKPIDDLSLVTANENYMTMVSSNGRLIKIPAELAQLAPHLQDKPLTEDFYEVMFGEGAYWKETLNEWRKKIVSLPVSSGDAFTSFIELLKTVQDK